MAQKASAKKTTKKTSSSKAKAAAIKRTKSERLAIEVFGIILVSLGALFGVYLYSGADGLLGTAIRSLLLGTVGGFAYALPIILILFGFFVILSGRQKRSRGTYLTAVLAAYSVICIIHLATSESLRTIKPYSQTSSTFGDYFMLWFKQFPIAWNESILSSKGGGVFGMILMTPLYMLGGYPLCYIVAIATLLICLLILTGISIKAYTEMFGTKVKDGFENVKNTYFTEEEDYDDADDELPSSPREWNKDLSQRPKPKAQKNTSKKQSLSFDELFEVPDQSSAQKKSVSESGSPVFAPSYSPVNMPSSSVAKGSAETKAREKRPDPSSPEFMPSTAKVKRKSNILFDIEETELSDQTDISDATSEEDISMPARKPNRTGKTKADPSGISDAPKDTSSAAAVKDSTASKEVSEDSDLQIPDMPDSPPAYTPPSIECLNKPDQIYSRGSESPEAVAKLLEETLQSFNISAQVVNYSVGPVVTRYELKPAPGIRVSKIAALSDDIALALAAARVRIEAPIPGKSAVGIEVPNKETATVLLREIIESPEFTNAKSTSTMAMGKDISGRIVVADLAKMPHMLIAGSTGSGKSVCINDIIISMIYKSSPQEIQMILIDPKVVELSVFANLPHLRVPVVTEPKKAASALRWAVNEMDMRYRKFSEVGSRDLARYNAIVGDPKKKMAKLVIIIDELADLMMVAPEDVEDSICRIAQLGRAAGIHLIVATQRPSADIITGLIKANIPSRCAFAVSSSIDSRIILDATGAEKLLGRGDMLFHPNGAGKPTRCQGAFVSDEEVERVMSHFKKENVQYDEDVINEINNDAKGGAQGGVFGEGKQEDELLGEAVRIVMENGQASISMIQRRLRVGYARAARLVDMMEQAHYVSGFDGSKPRQVLITPAEYNRVFGGGMPDAEPESEPNDEPPFDLFEETNE